MRMRPVQQKSPLPPCCQPIVAIVTWTMSTKAQLLWGDGGDGGALHLLMTQFSFQASVLWLFLSFLFGHLCPHFIIDCDRGSNKKSTKNHYSAPMNAPPPTRSFHQIFLLTVWPAGDFGFGSHLLNLIFIILIGERTRRSGVGEKSKATNPRKDDNFKWVKSKLQKEIF